jgi:hypothetical protein
MDDATEDRSRKRTFSGARRCDPTLWTNFGFERTSKTSQYLDFLIYRFASLSIPEGHTDKYAIELIAKECQIPVESLADELAHPVHTRGQVFFDFAGDAFDKIARGYADMRWWVSDVGLTMAVVKPLIIKQLPTFVELVSNVAGQTQSAESPPVRSALRRSRKYELIDEHLKDAAAACPRDHREVFRILEGRQCPIPEAEPFKTAGGFLAGFEKDPQTARAWLSKQWSHLGLPAFPRGPKFHRDNEY